MNDLQKSPASTLPLTDDQIEIIAERAADRAIEKLTNEAYKAVGKSVVQKLFWIVGVCAVALYMWLQQKGLVK
jgi:hypothetical protein